MKKLLRRDEPAPAALPTLEGERLTLRAPRPEDAADIFAYAQSPIVGPMAGWPPHKSMEDTQFVIDGFIAHGDVWVIVENASDTVIGTLGLHRDAKRDVCDARMIGYVLGERWWGKGYAMEASRLALRYAFETVGCPIVSIYHFPSNLQSKRVIEKMGYFFEGVLRLSVTLPDGSLTDELCYSMTRAEYSRLIVRKEAPLCRR